MGDSSFHHGVVWLSALMGCYVALFGWLSTFRDSVSVPIPLQGQSVQENVLFCDNSKPTSQPAHATDQMSEVFKLVMLQERQKYYIYHIVNYVVSIAEASKVCMENGWSYIDRGNPTYQRKSLPLSLLPP
jgi:hypothetical protein